MKLESKTLLAGAAALILLGSGTGLAMTGCSSSDSNDGDAGPGGGSSQGQPPTRPEADKTTDTSSRTFAVSSLKLGNNNEWKKLGYNIDGKVSTGSSKDVCAVVGSPVTSPHQDGDNGIDNSFGGVLLEVLNGIQGNLEGAANDALANGSFTIMIQTTGLPASPPANLTGLSGQLFAGGKFSDNGDGGLGAPPSFDLQTDWPVLPAILKDPNSIAAGSKISFANAYVADGLLVSGDRLTVTLNLNFSGIALALSVKNAVITAKPEGSNLTGGIISGYLVTSEVEKALRDVGGRLSLSFCGDAVDTFVEQLRSASDLLADGTTDGARDCDAISIGLGFNAKEIANPTKIAPAAPATGGDPCNDPDAGAN